MNIEIGDRVKIVSNKEPKLSEIIRELENVTGDKL